MLLAFIKDECYIFQKNARDRKLSRYVSQKFYYHKFLPLIVLRPQGRGLWGIPSLYLRL